MSLSVHVLIRADRIVVGVLTIGIKLGHSWRCCIVTNVATSLTGGKRSKFLVVFGAGMRCYAPLRSSVSTPPTDSTDTLCVFVEDEESFSSARSASSSCCRRTLTTSPMTIVAEREKRRVE